MRAVAEKNLKSTVDGLRAVELNYRSIREISSGQTAFLQTRTMLNSPNLGVLSPEQYRDVAEMTNQADQLFRLELIQALEANTTFYEREVSFNWLSVYLPVRLLRETRTAKFAADYAARYQVPTSRICFELSEKLLTENDEQVPNSIQSMRNLGFHFMLTNFGGSSCPMMRLSDYPVDYVMLSPEVSNYIGRGERSDNAVKSIISFVNDIGSEPVADGVFNSHQAEMLYSFECSYCAGSLSGKYMTERYVKRKSDS